MGRIKEIRRSKMESTNVEDNEGIPKDLAALTQDLRERWERSRPEKNHVEDAYFFKGVRSDGRLDSTGNPEMMSITIEYYESIEEAKKGNVKELRLWAYKDDAGKYAQGIINASLNRTLPPGW